MVEPKQLEERGESAYLPSARAERVIAIGRLILAAFSLLAVRLDPSTPAAHAGAAYLLLALYLGYSVALGLVVWFVHLPLGKLGLVTHVADLGLFCLFMYLTEGPTSPFFAYFTFSLVSATLRWQWRGALWTAAAALLAFNGMGLYAAKVVQDPAFELNRFIIRSVSLAVVAGLLGYLGAYEQRRRRELSHLAAWPRVLPRDPALLLRTVLRAAARILKAPRVLLVWEEPDEPWLHLTLWARGELRSSHEPPGIFHPALAESLVGGSFLSSDVRASLPLVLHASPTGIRSWRGAPLHPALQARFGIEAVLGVRLRGHSFDGHLLALDMQGMTADDLVLGEAVASHVTASMDHFLLSRRLQHTAATEQRIVLARDLHDGLLQSLTGAALQLQTVQRLLDTEPQAARERVAEIQRLIAAEQRDLRFFIHELRPTPESAGLKAALQDLAQRLEGVWGLRVELQAEGLDGPLPNGLAHEIYRLVQEALVNAARHAEASEAHVAVGLRDGHVCVMVADNGHGFPFRGEYDQAALTAQQLGPLMLKERLAALSGTLVITSTDAGARLEMQVPLARTGA